MSHINFVEAMPESNSQRILMTGQTKSQWSTFSSSYWQPWESPQFQVFSTSCGRPRLVRNIVCRNLVIACGESAPWGPGGKSRKPFKRNFCYWSACCLYALGIALPYPPPRLQPYPTTPQQHPKRHWTFSIFYFWISNNGILEMLDPNPIK